MNPLLLSAAIRRAEIPAFKLLGRHLVAGTQAHGYFGEFAATEVITGGDLASLVGVSQGTLFNDITDWLGFSLNGKRLLIAKKPIRYGVTWAHLHSNGVVFGKELTIAGKRYLVRLPKGASTDPTTDATGHDTPPTHGSEWNRMMYHVARDGTLTSEGIATGSFAQFTNTQLGVGRTSTGLACWCQETNSKGKVYRGGDFVSYNSRNPETFINSGMGWRPILELVE